ncbi:MAG: RNA polymerase sigma factor [Chitinophagia bacterium]|nr:RNA polymerase sigma factor [Chitinophagia bacterium]
MRALAPIATTYTEEQLVTLLRQKSRDGFNYLYKNYSAHLYTVIRKVISDEATANDLLQEVFVKIWNNIGQYDNSRGRLATWMMNIARNAAIDKLRSRGEIMQSKIRSLDGFVTDSGPLPAKPATGEAIDVKNHVQQLKPEYRDIINLSYFQGYTFEEVAEELKMPLGTVKTRMRSAMQQLRAIYNVNREGK